jgi:myo-inositol 2-dehydrogenase / D-chiro-inositol 1-dehydrogenase
MEKPNRREFLKLTSMAVAGTMLPLAACSTQETLISDKAIDPDVKLRVGLIGCGGRGTGAANQALSADPNVELVAVCDIFPDKIENALFVLKQRHGDKVNVPEARQFVGFDSYKDLINSGIDVVIHGAPPGFRPAHVEASVDAGLHMFVEKPVAVDAHGVRRMYEAVRKAKEKELSIVSGFCWRYHYPKRAVYERILNGAVGDIRTIYNTYNTGAARFDQRHPDWSDEEFQLRNWIYYNWMCGDHIVEQAVHSIDFMQWAMGDQLPVSAMGTGGRQVRVEPEFGDIYDHFAITYEYANGAKGFHFSRQQPNCENSYKAEIYGSDGIAIASVSRNQHVIRSRNNWEYDGEENNMYQTQHDELFAAIRRGVPINDGESMTNSTLVAIMGRMAAYTGRRISIEQALNSEEKLGPENPSWETIPKISDLKVPLPGVTPFV